MIRGQKMPLVIIDDPFLENAPYVYEATRIFHGKFDPATDYSAEILRFFLKTWRGPAPKHIRFKHKGVIPRRQRMRWCRHVLDTSEEAIGMFELLGLSTHMGIATCMRNYAKSEWEILYKGEKPNGPQG
jgi:hypothetical protein